MVAVSDILVKILF